MLDDRKLAVLRAIVEDFVSTGEPVGSKALVDRHHLDVSPATIRNDMSVLEEQGYIAQRHTSAGRIPTDKGYRLFVDRLSAIKPFSGAERRAIETFLAGGYDLDDVVMPVLKKWRIFEREDFTGEAAHMRDDLGLLVEELEEACDKFEVAKQRRLEREARMAERLTAKKVLETAGTLTFSQQ